MKKMLTKVFLCIIVGSCNLSFAAKKAIIADHCSLNIEKIPKSYIKKAKEKFKISYGHTSHGSQIVSGMQALAQKDSLFKYSAKNRSNSSFLWDSIPSGDLGSPNQEQWAKKTKEMLKSYGKSRNVVMWSWCGQLSRKKTDVMKYLKQLANLEKEFPKVTFIYMTGHLDGRGTRGLLHRNNEKIRQFCKKYHKVLFDFADIESYDPDGKINYNLLNCRDDCSYRKGQSKYNWAINWLAKNPKHNYVLPKRAAHTQPLNGAMKCRAFWYLLARLAGWKGEDKTKEKSKPVTLKMSVKVSS